MITSIVFIAVGVIVTLLIGKDLTTDFFVDLTHIDDSILTHIIQIVFIVIVFFGKMPYIFLVCRENILVFFDEIWNHSISINLEAKLADLKQKNTTIPMERKENSYNEFEIDQAEKS